MNPEEIKQDEDIKNIRSSIKGMINRTSSDGYLIYNKLFDNREIVKTEEGFSIFATNEDALEFQELLKAIHVKIQIIKE